MREKFQRASLSGRVTFWVSLGCLTVSAICLFPQIRSLIIRLTETYITRRTLNYDMWMGTLLSAVWQTGAASFYIMISFFISNHESSAFTYRSILVLLFSFYNAFIYTLVPETQVYILLAVFLLFQLIYERTVYIPGISPETSRLNVPKSALKKSALIFIPGTLLVICAIAILFPVFYPYQHEYREGAALVVTDNLLKGINPYSFDVQPENTYVYGCLYPLLAVPINFLFGMDIVNFRIMNILFSLVTTYVFYRFSKSFSISSLLRIILTICFFVGSAKRGLFAYPNALGTLLLILSISIPYTAGFKKSSLVVSAVLSILGFYTKPYFLIGILFVAAILFFAFSKKRALIYFMVSMFAWVISLCVINLFFPAYLNNNLFHHMSVASYAFDHMRSQVHFFLSSEFFLTLSAGTAYMIFWKKRKAETGGRIAGRRLKEIMGKFDAPFIGIDWKRSTFDICLIIPFILFVLKLGGHTGADQAAYLYDMLYPFVFFLITVKLDRFEGGKFLSVSLALLLICNLFSYTASLVKNARMLTLYSARVKEIEYELVGKDCVFIAPSLVSSFVKRDLPVNTSGQTEYFITGDTKYGRLIYGDKIQKITDEYLSDISGKIRAKEYDLVLTTWSTYGLPENMEDYYTFEKELKYPGLVNGFSIGFWTPRK